MRPAVRIVFAPLFKRAKRFQKGGASENLYLHGEVTIPGRTIKLDPRGSEILDTLVHELAHITHPDWTEQMVRDYTKLRMKKMGWKDKARMLKWLGSAKIEGEEDDKV